MNRLLFGPTTMWTPVIGSATSVLVASGFVWALFRLARRDFPLSQVAPVRALSLVLALFFGVEALSGLLAWNGAATAKEIARNLVFLAFLPIYSRIALSARGDIRRSLEAAALAAALAMLPLSLMQVWGYHIRAEGGAGNAVPFALSALVTYSILVLGCLRAAGRRRILFALAALAAAACIALSGTRILWPGIAVVPLIAAFLYRSHFERPRIGKAAGAAILAGLALLVLVAYGTVERRLELAVSDVEAALSLDDYSGSFGQRLAIWKVGLDLFAEAPLFGHGPANAQALLAERTQALLGTPLTYSHYHNGLLTYAVRDGIPGALAVLAMLLAPLVLASRRVRDETGAYGLAFTACLVASYALSGSMGILFGHDILDALYVASLVAGAHLMFGSDPDRHLRP